MTAANGLGEVMRGHLHEKPAVSTCAIVASRRKIVLVRDGNPSNLLAGLGDFLSFDALATAACEALCLFCAASDRDAERF
ncbi:MAG TPA: hypothetical protein VF727_10485 [Allosphingosinicella sp.]|jgi:hypothetical protein